MKRILSLLLSVLFLLTALPTFTVFASTEGKVIGTVDKETVCPGEEITLTVSMENNPGLVCWLIDVVYDDSVLELVEQTAGNAFANSGSLSFGPKKNPTTALWYDFLSPTDYTNNGVLFSFTFKVKEDAAFGESAITLYCSDYDNMCNSDFERANFAFVSPTMAIGHEYDNACDDLCNKCFTEREVPGHAYANDCAEICESCGFNRVAPHNYSNACDTECNLCGAMRDTIHTYDNDCDADCNICGLVRKTAHIYDNVCDADCNLCGATRAASHAYVNPAKPVCAICGAVGIFTEPTVYGVVDKASVVLGSTFTLSVMMENNPGLASWLVELAYDEDVLELTAQSAAGSAFSGVTFGPLKSPANGLWFDFLKGDNTTNGLLYTATFTVKEDAPLGASAITLFCSDPENMCNFDFGEVHFDFVSAGIVVSEHTHTYDHACDTDCNECGELRTITHAYDTVVEEPTCSEAGLITSTCTVCGAIDTEVLPATGDHAFTTETVEPTCNEAGLITDTCSVCGTIETTVLPATGDHRYVNPANPVCGICGVACVITGPTVYGVVDNYTVARGYTFTLSVVMANNPGLAGWLIDVDFDTTILELTSQTFGDAFSGIGSQSFGKIEKQSPANCLWYDFISGENYTNNGTLFTMTFKVKEDAAFGASPITLYCSDYDNMCTIDYEKVDFTFVSTTVDIVNHIHSYDADCATACNVCGATREPLAEHTYTHIYDATCDACGAVREVEYLPGDLNYDGKVNIRDLGLLQQALNNWDVDVDPFFADLNADGKMNIRDLGLLQQYLNNWDVELKLAL